MSFIVVIPARYASQRLPAKPLADIAGKPMIERVYQRALESQADEVIVATDDQRIHDVVVGFGGKCCMTRADHESGTDRLQEVAQQLQLKETDIVINVQGDEPLIPPVVIDQVAENLIAAPDASVATLCEKIEDIDQVFDPNIVKVVADVHGLALYFSRASIPWVREGYSHKPPQLANNNLALRHIGIYAYRVKLLNEFVTWPMAPLEQLEKLEQLRVLYNGHKIHVQEACEVVPGGIDTPADLVRINQMFQ
ncbi:3-deoxy-manno-octulosonate cytidylyltransferase [Thalassocella blandensis]|nr:3-deoxy-manno-octulosonate cytidylyltransferase [Thalassocella blandensis]